MFRYLFLLLIVSIIFSCVSEDDAESQAEQNKEESNLEKEKEHNLEEILTRRWVYKEKTSEDGKEKFSYADSPSDVVLRLDENGYFMIYDSITDPKFVKKGVRRIEQRYSGQWELSKDDILIMRKILNDTIIVDSMLIREANHNELITSTMNRKSSITYFSID